MSHFGKHGASKVVLLGIGANVPGRWGTPRASVARALQQIEKAGVKITAVSPWYSTTPVGNTAQPPYINAVVSGQACIAPGTLLRILKRIERDAGRTMTRYMARRPLDIDILDFGGRRIGQQGRRRQRGGLVLPHPEIRGRAFVLVPLRDVAPFWRHPVSGASVTSLIARLAPASLRGVSPSP